VKEISPIWALRCSIAIVLFLGTYSWFLRDPATGAQAVSLLLLSLPWLVALFVPLGKVDIAAGLVVGGTWAMTPAILLLTILGLEISVSLAEGVALVLAMGLASVVGIRLSLQAFKWQQRTALILAACIFLYEATVMRAVPLLASFRPATEARPLEAMFRAQICLDRYKQAHGTYPDTLKPMTNQEHCLDEALLKAIDISYTARKEPVPGYNLNIEHRALWTNLWNGLSSSELGVIQQSHNIGGSREVTSVLSRPNAAQLIHTLSQCLDRFQRSGGSIPVDLSDMWNKPWACPESTFVARGNSFQVVGYSYRYVAGPGNSTFELSARPDRYGVTGVRSYYLDSQGRIHVTLEDRAAVLSDGFSPPCEYEINVPCSR